MIAHMRQVLTTRAGDGIHSVWMAVAGLWLLAAVAAAGPEQGAMRILRDQCLGCHKPGKAKGGLLLTTREKMLAGGDTGPAVVPGKGADSLLVQLVHEDGDPHMPPKKQLADVDVQILRTWVDAGAVWDPKVFDELPSVKPVQLGALPKGYQPVLALTLSADGKRLAVARANSILVHDLSVSDRPVLARLEGHTAPVQSLAWSPDGRWLVSGGFRQIRLWEVTSWKEAAVLTEQLVGNITALVVGADNTTLFAADGEQGGAGFIHRWNLMDRKHLAAWKAHDDTVYSLRLSRDGQSLASAGADKLAKLWKVADGSLIAFYEGHTNHVLAVALNQDTSQLATAGADREIKVWDVKAREQDVVLGDKRSVYTALDWTPDGKFLVTVTDKGAGSIYSELEKHTGEQRSGTGKEKKLESVSQNLSSVQISADGKTVFGGGQDGVVYVWTDNGKLAGKLAP